MPYTVHDILRRCRDTLIDQIKPPNVDGLAWKNEFLLSHANTAIASIVQVDKKASVVRVSQKLTRGTEQMLPADAVNFIRSTMNMGADGLTPGRVIRPIRIERMDAARPNWRTDPPSKVVRHIMASPEDPRRFDNWPPSDGTNFIRHQYEQVPDDTSVTYTNATTGSAGGPVLPMSNTFGIAIGQTVYDLTAMTAVIAGTTVLSIAPNSSVTLSGPIAGAVGAADVMVFSDKFPLPDLYAEPAYLFVLAHAYAKNTDRGDVTKMNLYWSLFQSELGIDQQTLDRLNIGKPDS